MNNSSSIKQVRSQKNCLKLEADATRQKIWLSYHFMRRVLPFDSFVDRGLFIRKCVLN